VLFLHTAPYCAAAQLASMCGARPLQPVTHQWVHNAQIAPVLFQQAIVPPHATMSRGSVSAGRGQSISARIVTALCPTNLFLHTNMAVCLDIVNSSPVASRPLYRTRGVLPLTHSHLQLKITDDKQNYNVRAEVITAL
jgi:hypothetical protein